MWASGHDLNEEGTPVSLYVPIYSKSKRFVPTCKSSYIGGKAVLHNPQAELSTLCGVCGDPLYCLAQVYTPMDGLERSLHVLACNRYSCGNHPGRTVRCIRSQKIPGTGASATEKDLHDNHHDDKQDCGWGMDDEPLSDDDDDWGDDGGEDLHHVEAMLSAVELGHKKDKTKTAYNTTRQSQKIEVSDRDCLECFEIEWLDEPEGEKDDDDGVALVIYNKRRDAHAERLLAKYYNEEEDTGLVETLKALTKSNKPAKSQQYDSDEDETIDTIRNNTNDAIFESFTRRVKRQPDQVIRYAYKGQPMWSRYVYLQTQSWRLISR